MSRRFHKRRRAILAQREMLAVMAEEELQREALEKINRELDQLDRGMNTATSEGGATARP
jgi:hypothetical protein